MATLTRVVRPNETVDVRPVRPALAAGQRLPPDGVPTLAWGSGGDSIFTVDVAQYSEVEVIEQRQEVSRTVDVVRQKNPENTDQYVDVESVREVITRGADGKKSKTTYKPVEIDATREMLQKGKVINSG